MNCDPKSWNHILLSHKLTEIRVVVNGLRFASVGKMLGFLDQQEPLGDTLVAARRDTRVMGFICFGV